MNISELIISAKTIWLSTHKSADGDGLGSEMALYYALKKKSHSVKVIHNDLAPKRYQFLLNGTEVIDTGAINKEIFSDQDVAIIFDTHDPKLCSPLFDYLQEAKTKIIFIDHHVLFEKKLEGILYHIDETASCTGEIVLDLINKMNIALDYKIATALYTSLLFDTQNFKHQRDSVKILDMAKTLILSGADHNRIHRELFDTWSIDKMNYLSRLINQVVYKNNEIAIIQITRSELNEFGLVADDVSDLVDLFMSVKNINISIVIREDGPNFHKLSFRSRTHEILSWAREFGGGGHLYSAGAWVHESCEVIINKINSLIAARKP